MAFLIPHVMARPLLGSSELFLRRCFGTSAPEIPVVGSDAWKQMLNNLAAHQTHPPLSTREIASTQRLTEVEKNVSDIKKMVERVLQSNQQTHNEVHQMFQFITKQ